MVAHAARELVSNLDTAAADEVRFFQRDRALL